MTRTSPASAVDSTTAAARLTMKGSPPDTLVQSRRDRVAARKFCRLLPQEFAYVPRVVLTDKRASYGATGREFLARIEYRRHRRSNNRAERAYQPISGDGMRSCSELIAAGLASIWINAIETLIAGEGICIQAVISRCASDSTWA